MILVLKFNRAENSHFDKIAYQLFVEWNVSADVNAISEHKSWMGTHLWTKIQFISRISLYLVIQLYQYFCETNKFSYWPFETTSKHHRYIYELNNSLANAIYSQVIQLSCLKSQYCAAKTLNYCILSNVLICHWIWCRCRCWCEHIQIIIIIIYLYLRPWCCQRWGVIQRNTDILWLIQARYYLWRKCRSRSVKERGREREK